METTKVLSILKNFKQKRGSFYGIQKLGLFGSTARGEQTTKSDIDVCLKLEHPSFFSRMASQEELENIFKCKVDVVSLGSIMRPLFRQSLEEDAIYV